MTIKTNIITKEKTYCFSEAEYRTITDCILSTYAFCESRRPDYAFESTCKNFNEELARAMFASDSKRMEEIAADSKRLLRLFDGKLY